MNTIKVVTLGLISAFSLYSSHSSAEGPEYFSDTNIQVSYTESADTDTILGYGSESGKRVQTRIEHQSEYSFGENYFFVDLIRSDTPFGGIFGEGDKEEAFGVWNTNVSLSKLTGKAIAAGLITDVSLEARFEYGSYYNYSSKGLGASVYLDVPGYSGRTGDKFQISYWRRQNCDDFVEAFSGGECYEDHNFWGITARSSWEMLGQEWQHQLFVRYQEDTGGTWPTKRNNRLWVEAEAFMYLYRGLSLGVRLEYFRDAGGIDDNSGNNDRFTPMAVVKLDF